MYLLYINVYFLRKFYTSNSICLFVTCLCVLCVLFFFVFFFSFLLWAGGGVGGLNIKNLLYINAHSMILESFLCTRSLFVFGVLLFLFCFCFFGRGGEVL